jgi:phosphoglycolate phosphatase-like HAD superfamily hydrolase
MNLSRYATLVFDCDGVLLDSNSVKTEAFRSTAMPWDETAAEALATYHVANGGVSRYEKFAHFLDNILPEHADDAVPGHDGPCLDTLLATFAQAARSGLMNCSIADGLENLRAATTGLSWMVVSGGDQVELREIFDKRGLAHLFDAGIFGSPDPKARILEREIDRGRIQYPALFLGDSRLDHEVAQAHGMEFLFVSEWTDLDGWEDYVSRHGLDAVPTVGSLLEETPATAPEY